MSAFLAKVLQAIGTNIAKAFIRYVVDHYTAWEERHRHIKEQEEKDERTKKPYNEAVKDGTKDDIRRATEDRLNS